MCRGANKRVRTWQVVLAMTEGRWPVCPAAISRSIARCGEAPEDKGLLRDGMRGENKREAELKNEQRKQEVITVRIFFGKTRFQSRDRLFDLPRETQRDVSLFSVRC